LSSDHKKALDDLAKVRFLALFLISYRCFVGTHGYQHRFASVAGASDAKVVVEQLSTMYIDKTGSGKSAVHTLAGKFNEAVLGNVGKGLVVIVEPTNLCHDVARQLQTANLGGVIVLAGALENGASAPATFRDITSEQLNEAKFIVIVPEMFDIAASPEAADTAVAVFLRELRLNQLTKIALFSLDESHLYGSWSWFRPAMLTVLNIARGLNCAKLLLSATVTDATMNLLRFFDSRHKLFEEIGDIRRPDLAPTLVKRSGDCARDYCELAKHISERKPDETIVIVCARFRLMEELINYLESLPETRDKMLDSNVSFRWHGATSVEEKARVVKRLDGQPIGVLIASASFSHGVNLRPTGALTVYVIGCFDTVAMLLQAFGRASRSGDGDNVYWFVRSQDFAFVIKATQGEADTLDAEIVRRNLSLAADDRRLLLLRKGAAERDVELLRALCHSVAVAVDSAGVARADTHCVMHMLQSGFLSSPPINATDTCDATCKCVTRVVDALLPRTADGIVAIYYEAQEPAASTIVLRYRGARIVNTAATHRR
jgi:superfamily II DNA helicase RecQ